MANLDTPHQNDYDIIMVGAGVVGCAVANGFGTDGRRVLLIERDLSEPDRIVGELLQPGGMDALRELGMEDCVNDIDGIPCYGYGVFFHGEQVHIPYPKNNEGKKAIGTSFHQGLLALHQSMLLLSQLVAFRSAEAPPDPHHNHPSLLSPSVTVVEGTANTLICDADEHEVIGVSYLPKGEKEEFQVHAKKNCHAYRLGPWCTVLRVLDLTIHDQAPHVDRIIHNFW